MVGSIHNIHSFFLVCEIFKGSVGKYESSTCYRMERTIFFISYIWGCLFFSYAIGERGVVKMSKGERGCPGIHSDGGMAGAFGMKPTIIEKYLCTSYQ
jgi:hypothetical protein